MVNFVVSIAISKFTPAPPHDVQEMVEEIRLPAGASEASVH